MNPTPPIPEVPDPFENVLRRRLGPAGRLTPPPALRAAVLARVAALPPPEPRFRLRPAVLATASALGFLGLVGGWLLTRAPGGKETALARLADALASSAANRPEWRDSLAQLLGRADWLELLRSPLALAVLPILLLPLLYFFQDEGSRG